MSQKPQVTLVDTFQNKQVMCDQMATQTPCLVGAITSTFYYCQQQLLFFLLLLTITLQPHLQTPSNPFLIQSTCKSLKVFSTYPLLIVSFSLSTLPPIPNNNIIEITLIINICCPLPITFALSNIGNMVGNQWHCGEKDINNGLVTQSEIIILPPSQIILPIWRM